MNTKEISMESESLRIKTYILENLSELFTDIVIISKALGTNIGKIKVLNGRFYLDKSNSISFPLSSIDYIRDKIIFIKF